MQVLYKWFVQRQAHLSNATESGFTLPEVLIVIVIVGILSSLTLPSMMKYVSKAKEVEAVEYVGMLNRTQQLRRHEYGYFASDFIELEVGIPTETASYRYELDIPDISSEAIQRAIPYSPDVRAIIGAVHVSNGIAYMQLCKSIDPIGYGGGTGGEVPVFPDDRPAECPGGYEPL